MGIIRTKGFTLLELMIAIAIIGILAAVTYPKFNSTKTMYHLHTSSKRCMMDMRYAQQLSIDTKDKHGVYFSPTSYQIRNTASGDTIKTVSFKNGVTYASDSLESNAVIFGIDGTPFKAGGLNPFSGENRIDLVNINLNMHIYIYITPSTGEVSVKWD